MKKAIIINKRLNNYKNIISIVKLKILKTFYFYNNIKTNNIIYS